VMTHVESCYLVSRRRVPNGMRLTREEREHEEFR